MYHVLLLFAAYLSLSLAVDLRSLSSRFGDLLNPDNQYIRLVESERIQEYHRRNYTWPITEYNPTTAGWKQLMDQRFAQVHEIEQAGQRYEGFIQTIHSAFLVPNFTEHGFGLARCPDELLGALQQGIRKGLPNARLEQSVEVILGPNPPIFVDRPDLTQRVLHELQHYAETWSGVSLTPYRAYGFRLYRNESRLLMHVDKMQTHIISFILHIDSSDDAEPWPIFIEDYHGQTHEVILTPGDILFYESSKCFHGRPRPLNGSWYSSLFVHYYPSDGWYNLNHKLEAHYAVPPEWKTVQNKKKHPQLQMVGTSMTEPVGCGPAQWCRADESVKWSGPGEVGYWIAPTGEKYKFEPKKVEYNEEL